MLSEPAPGLPPHFSKKSKNCTWSAHKAQLTKNHYIIYIYNFLYNLDSDTQLKIVKFSCFRTELFSNIRCQVQITALEQLKTKYIQSKFNFK